MAADRCSSCKAPIFWALTAKGKRMPLDAQPDPQGIVWLHGGVAHVGDQPPAMGATDRYTSHFATCPNAGKWRKR